MNVVVAKNEKALKALPPGIDRRADLTIVSGKVRRSRLPGEMEGRPWKKVAKALRANGHSLRINDSTFISSVKRNPPNELMLQGSLTAD